MRRIKSAPANIAGMVNRKKVREIPEVPKVLEVPEVPKIPEVSKINKNDNIIKSEIKPFSKNNNPIDYKFKKDFANNKKKITTTLSGIISDSFIETNKYIPDTDTYVFNYVIEFINNFIANKFNRKNLENFILSLMIRFIASQVYHDIIIKVKENIHVIT